MQTRIDDIGMPEGRLATTGTARNADSVLHLVGQKWLLFVLRDICKGRSRFNQIQASLGISRALLTNRLRMLAAEGMIEMTALPGRKRRHYAPTAKGRALYQIILQMQNWQLTH
jgi:DNA-binding HxlR family transcriptional regulator